MPPEKVALTLYSENAGQTCAFGRLKGISSLMRVQYIAPLFVGQYRITFQEKRGMNLHK